MAEEEQQFLGRQQVFLQQGLPAAGSSPGMLAGVQKTPDRKVLGSPGVQGSPKKVCIIVNLLTPIIADVTFQPITVLLSNWNQIIR